MKAEKDSLFYDHFAGGAAEAAGSLTPRFTSPPMVGINRFIKRAGKTGGYAATRSSGSDSSAMLGYHC